MADTYDSSTINQVKEHAEELKKDLADRDTLFDKLEKMFNLDWQTDKPDKEHVKITISPDARNTALGAIRLMIATDPTFSIPYDKSNQMAKEMADKLETAANSMWYLAGRLSQNPISYDLVRSAILFGEGVITVSSTRKMLEDAKGAAEPALNRIRRANQMTPYIFEVVNPRQCYPDYDNLGLSTFYRERKVRGSRILDAWGSAAKKLIGEDRLTEFTLCDYWNSDVHHAYILEKDGNLFSGKHELPVIPIASQIIEGSNMFTEKKYSRQPFLYTLQKSGFWERTNLIYTILYTMLFTIGNGPVWGYEKLSADNDIDINYDNMGGYVSWMKGENFQPLLKQTIDPGNVQAAEMAENKIAESTIYRQALGEPVGGSGASYSMVSLLNHAGRLPLTAPKQGSGWLMGSAMQIAFEMMRKDKVNKVLTMEGGIIEIDPKQLPDPLLVDGNLEINLPQDQRINAMTANGLTQGEKPLTSRRWARENLLGIGQSNKMTQEIWEEMFADIESMNEYATQLEMANQRITAARQTGMINKTGGNVPGQANAAPAPQPGPEMQTTPMPGGQQAQPPGGIPQGAPGMNPASIEGIPPEVFEMDEGSLRQFLAQQGLPPEQVEPVVQMINQIKQGNATGMAGQMPGVM